MIRKADVMSNANKIIIGADLVPTKSNEVLFASGDAEDLIGNDLKKLFNDADYRIFNLEVPLTDIRDPIAKCGPNLIAPTATVKGYAALGVDLLTLANNHILDQGEQGLDSTCRVLSENRISYLGAGGTPDEAAKPYIFTHKGKKIGVYACAEHEFTIVTEKSAGANPFDPLESPDHVSALKAECDFVIVLYHGGKEHYRYPSPALQKICRKLVDKGADLVVCQHSHCIGCEEKYKHGTIVYGQGNFLFDLSEIECWQTGLLIGLNDALEINYIPVVKSQNKVRLADKEQSDAIIDAFRLRSREIMTPGVIESKYADFAKTMANHYLFLVSGRKRSLPFRVLNKLSGYRLDKMIINKRYTKEKKLAIINAVDCEAHRELMLCGLSDFCGTDKKGHKNAK